MDLETTQYLSHSPWGEEAGTKRTIGVPPSFLLNEGGTSASLMKRGTVENWLPINCWCRGGGGGGVTRILHSLHGGGGNLVNLSLHNWWNLDSTTISNYWMSLNMLLLIMRGLSYSPKAETDNKVTTFDNSWYREKTEFYNCFILQFFK